MKIQNEVILKSHCKVNPCNCYVGITAEKARIIEWNADLLSALQVQADLLSALQWFADELPGIIRQYCPEGVPIQVAHAHEAARNAIAKAKGAV